MDEENTVQAENVEVVEDNSQDTSPVDETTTSESTETDETPSAEESSEETEVEAERKPTRAERRIRDLVDENKRLKEQSSQQFPGYQQPPYPVIEPGQELTQEQYQQHVVQAADTIAQLRTQQQIDQFKAEANLDRDVEVLPKEFPELDEKSPDFNPILVEKIEAAFKQRAFNNGALDPNVRLADVAKDFVDVARAAAKQSTTEMKNAVAKTADTTAIRPGSGVRQEKSASDMSIDELEAKLGTVR